jgi:hypothetical protein
MSPSDVYEQLKANRNPVWVENWDFLLDRERFGKLVLSEDLTQFLCNERKNRDENAKYSFEGGKDSFK